MATRVKFHCASCDREWVENIYHPDHITGSERSCPFPDCLRKGLLIHWEWKDKGGPQLWEDW